MEEIRLLNNVKEPIVVKKGTVLCYTYYSYGSVGYRAHYQIDNPEVIKFVSHNQLFFYDIHPGACGSDDAEGKFTFCCDKPGTALLTIQEIFREKVRAEIQYQIEVVETDTSLAEHSLVSDSILSNPEEPFKHAQERIAEIYQKLYEVIGTDAFPPFLNQSGQGQQNEEVRKWIQKHLEDLFFELLNMHRIFRELMASKGRDLETNPEVIRWEIQLYSELILLAKRIELPTDEYKQVIDELTNKQNRVYRPVQLQELQEKIELAITEHRPIDEYVREQIRIAELAHEEFRARAAREGYNIETDPRVIETEIRQYSVMKQLAEQIGLPTDEYDQKIRALQAKTLGEEVVREYFGKR